MRKRLSILKKWEIHLPDVGGKAEELSFHDRERLLVINLRYLEIILHTLCSSVKIFNGHLTPFSALNSSSYCPLKIYFQVHNIG